jgi:hypothetical protein
MRTINRIRKKNIKFNMKIVYIAHPIGGDVKNNLKKIIAIVRYLNLTEPEMVPFAPYFADCEALDDSNELERARGIKNCIAMMRSGVVDELWLYGDKISPGMGYEIAIAIEEKIKIVSKSIGTSSFKCR